MSEFNIKSSTIEKGLDVAKEFTNKLVGPTVEQIGLLFADKIQYFRLKNQIKIVIKTKKFVDSQNIKIKELPIKILAPLLEQGSFEENEDLQDLWAKMLANMIDSDKNLQNNIYPYILGQLSIQEYDALKNLESLELEFEKNFNKLRQLEIELDKDYEKNNLEPTIREEKREARFNLYRDLNDLDQSGFKINLINTEVSNIERLGLIRRMPPKIHVSGGNSMSIFNSSMYTASYNMQDFGHRMTALGFSFLDVCKI
tara:strand:+ start:56 stop:823 length:768 start_codon:yes stop_codon:yes gene_type:complete